jgi:dTDP-6-deoxy-L-talose 4-dehydrogenase (NAD+)
MRTVAVTGASGFIGRHVVNFLRTVPGYRVVATGRDEARLKSLDVEYVVLDLANENCDCFALLGQPEILIHLAWGGLPRYRDLFHIEQNLMASYRFITAMVSNGVSAVTVAGTCYEYGLQSGCLNEAMQTQPTTCYAIAKDSLRQFLEQMRQQYPFRLCWGRLFFSHGAGQNHTSLFPQLDHAIASGAESFDMSGGEQLRDYLRVEDAAVMLAKVALQNTVDGIFNICSGVPVSVRRLAEERIASMNSHIRLNLGAFPYPEHEPMAYWGDPSRARQAMIAFDGGGADD